MHVTLLQATLLIFITLRVCVSPTSAFAMPPLRLADVIANSAPDAQGTRIAADTVVAIHSNIHSLNIAPAAIQTYEFTSDLIEHVNLGGVFESKLPVTSAANERLFNLTGTKQKQSFLIDAPRLRSEVEYEPRPFEFVGELRVRRNQNPIPDEALGYGLKSKLIADVGTINHRILMRYVSGLLGLIDPNNLDLLREQRSHDAATLDEFASTFPNAYDLTNRYLDYQPNIKTLEVESKRINHVATVATLKVDKLKKRYPALSQWIERLLTMGLQLDITQRLPSGHTIVRWRINFDTRSFVQELYTFEGKLVPFDDHAKLDLANGVDLANINSINTTSLVNYNLDVLGLKISGRNIVVDASYQDGPIASFVTRVKELPTPSIEGRFLGVLPSWAIDMTIPGNMEDYARRFCQGTLAANSNEGSFSLLRIDTTKPTTLVEAKGGTEIVDNFFLKTGLRIIQSYLWPEPDVIHDAWRLSSAYVNALNMDLQKLVATQTRVSSLVH